MNPRSGQPHPAESDNRSTGLTEAAALLPSLGRWAKCSGIFGRAISHRAELAGVELREARTSVVAMALLGAFAGGLTLLAGMTLIVIVAALAWDTPYRVWALVGLILVELIGVGIATARLRHRIRDWKPLEETTRQLKHDRQCLQQLLTDEAN